MSVLESLDLDNIPEVEILPPDEYEMKVISSEVKDSTADDAPADAKNVVVILEAVAHPNANHVFRYFSLPNSGDTERTRNQKLRWLKEFLDAFKLDKSDIGTEGAKGAVGWALLGTRTYDGREQNDVKKFIVPA